MVVNQHTLLTADVVYTALRIISNNLLRMGNLLPFTWAWSKDNIKYKQYIRDDRPILTNTFGGGSLGGQAGAMMQCTGMDRTIWSMALWNEAFWYILRDPELLTPMAIEVLHPAFMVVQKKDGQPIYKYGPANDAKILPPENVIQIYHKSLPTALRALNPVDYAGVAGGLALAAYEFGSSWFAQGQSPSYFLTTEQKLGQDEVERIADKFLIRHGGLAQAHTPVVLDSGIKATKIMATPDEAQYLSTLEYARQVIGSWFGIPSSKMPNALQRQPAAPPHTRQEEQIDFIQDTLSGYMLPLQEVYSALLGPGEFACFDEDKLNQPDAQFLAQEIQALRITQAASINDVRVRKLGWAPVDDPAADDALAPLASNTAPSQTEDKPAQSTGTTTPQGKTGQEGRERERVIELMRFVVGREDANREQMAELIGAVRDASDAQLAAYREAFTTVIREQREAATAQEARGNEALAEVRKTKPVVNVDLSPVADAVHQIREQQAATAQQIEALADALRNLPAPEVTVKVPKQDPPTIDVHPAPVVVPPSKPRRSKVQRDRNGFITGIEHEE